MRNSENVLNSLAGHSQDPDYKFERLYRLLFNENLYALAYQNIASNPGNCTKGADGQSIDGMSVKRIHGLIGRLKDESYKPCPAKRVYIPKKNGKMRPIGIPAFDDKLVQEVLKMILESIYEGHFEKCSHGFRPHRSCHTALASISDGFSGMRWFIEGDIKGFFDNIDHEVLRPYRAYSKCRSGNLPGKGFRCRSLANLSTQPKGGGECRMLETA